jgi:hypothetical protein
VTLLLLLPSSSTPQPLLADLRYARVTRPRSRCYQRTEASCLRCLGDRRQAVRSRKKRAHTQKPRAYSFLVLKHAHIHTHPTHTHTQCMLILMHTDAHTHSEKQARALLFCIYLSLSLARAHARAHIQHLRLTLWQHRHSHHRTTNGPQEQTSKQHLLHARYRSLLPAPQ